MIDVCDMAPHLAVFDMPTSLKFYCDVLGCRIVASDGESGPEFNWVMLSLNGVRLMLNTAYDGANRPPQPEAARIAAHEDTTLYFGCPDVDAAFNHLRAMGVKVKAPEVAWYGMRQLYVSDPDGYLLCFQWKAEEQPPRT